MNETIRACHEPARRAMVLTAMPSMRICAEPRRGSFGVTSVIAVPVNRSERVAPDVLDDVSVRRHESADATLLHDPRRTIELLRSSTGCMLTTGPVAHGLQLPAASTARTRKRYDTSYDIVR